MPKRKQCYFLGLFIILILNCGCIKRGDNPADPYETYNRKAFELNQKLDETFFRRPAKMYNTVIPAGIRKMITNVYNNLLEPRNFINFLLQKEVSRAMNSLVRFGFNSTWGLLGVADVASSIGHKPDNTDFGVTLAKWGDKDSPYIYSAIAGPSTIRDSVGSVYDAVLFPPYLFLVHTPIYVGASAFYIVTLRAQLLESEGLINEASIDRYVMIRDAYLQRRNFLITGKKVEVVSDDELFSDEDSDLFDDDDLTEKTECKPAQNVKADESATTESDGEAAKPECKVILKKPKQTTTEVTTHPGIAPVKPRPQVRFTPLF